MLYFYYTYLGSVYAGSFEESEQVYTQNDVFAEERRLVKALRYFRGLKRDNMKRSEAGKYQLNSFHFTKIIKLSNFFI